MCFAQHTYALTAIFSNEDPDKPKASSNDCHKTVTNKTQTTVTTFFNDVRGH